MDIVSVQALNDRGVSEGEFGWGLHAWFIVFYQGTYADPRAAVG